MMSGILTAVLLSLAAPQGVTQKNIDEAIHRGIQFLRTAPSPGHAHSKAKHCDELILYTFIHAGVRESDPKFQTMLKRILADPVAQTYKVSLQAMLLEELHRVKYQGRIAQCAQFLVDNQCQNGQWSYGEPTVAVQGIPSSDPRVSTSTKRKKGLVRFSRFTERVKPKVTRKITVAKTREGKATGDNSNTQYAALGLRACFDSGINLPESVVVKARQWWIQSQHAPADGADKNAVASSGSRPRGWNYKKEGEGRAAYGSMTAGATGGLAIYDYLLGNDFKKNPHTQAGLSWLASNFSVTQNPGRNKDWYLYYLYGLERAGMLCDVKMMGKHDWYLEGAAQLLKIQQGNGAWKGRNETWGTCFAILFLKKATRPLVASEDVK